MAALLDTHARLSGSDALPQSKDDQSDSGGSVGSDGELPDTSRNHDEEEQDGDGSSDGGEEVEGGGHGEEGGSAGNGGWAMAMAKILGKKTPVSSSSSILVKNQQLDRVKEKAKQELLEKKKQVDKKRLWESMCREKPGVVKDRETERALQRIATRGVVQLFNAVRTHQKNVDDSLKDSGSSDRKKAKLLSSVSKRDFIDVLRRTEGGGRVSHSSARSTAESAAAKPNWSVLDEDYMMGASMKDWDKDSETEDAGTDSRK